jgi:hypothetical protein
MSPPKAANWQATIMATNSKIALAISTNIGAIPLVISMDRHCLDAISAAPFHMDMANHILGCAFGRSHPVGNPFAPQCF